MAPWQVVPALVVIGGAICLIGALPLGVHKLFNNGETRRTQAMGIDKWTHALLQRDKQLKEEAAQKLASA